MLTNFQKYAAVYSRMEFAIAIAHVQPAAFASRQITAASVNTVDPQAANAAFAYVCTRPSPT